MAAAELAVLSFDDALNSVAEYAPLPQELDAETSYVLVASDFGLASKGLMRATLVMRQLSSAQRLRAFRPVQTGGFLEATVQDFTMTDSGLVLARDVTVSDRIGLHGNVIETDEGYRVTLPPEQNKRRGERFVVPFGHSEAVTACIKARNYRVDDWQQHGTGQTSA